MAARNTKTQTTKKKPAASKKAPQQTSSAFQNEIILLVVLAAALILIVSVLGFGGIVGNALGSILFGTMGYLAYPFPVILFVCIAFLLSNRRSGLALRKFLAGVVFFVVLCGMIQLLTEGYLPGNTLKDYYSISSDYRTGGGAIGGAVCFSTAAAFGVVGGSILMVLVLLVCLIVITQRSFFGFLFKIGDRIGEAVQDSKDRYQEGQPQRELKKELKAQQKQRLREERRAQKMRELEEQIAEEEAASLKEASAVEQLKKVPTSTDHRKTEDPGFLSGTWLMGNEPQEPAAIEEPEEEPEIIETVPAPKKTRKAKKAPAPAPVFEFDFETGQEESIFGDEPEDEVVPEPVEEEDPYKDADIREHQAAIERIEQPNKAPAKNPKSSPQEITEGIHNVAKEIANKEAEPERVYHYPPLNLMTKGDGRSQGESDEQLRKTAQKLQETLYNFGVNVKVVNVSCGPTVTRYELQPEMGVKVSKIVNLADDIKLNLACADIRIEAPIPGKAAVGIEVPNKENSAVHLRDLLESKEFQSAKSKLAFAAGKDIAGKPVVTDIAKMPHLLIAGATGSGKSVCINTLIISILYKASPDEVKLIMIDPKVVELSVYNGIPHLLIPVVTDPKKAAGALNWAVQEMTNRYNTFAEYSVRNLGEYNKKVENMRIPEGEERPAKLPQIVIIVDELADLMMVAPGEVEDAICRLAQLARAAGIHLIIATQRPSVNVITGLIKANMPSRIAFSVSSGVDSRTILDMNGAEKLLGKGDMLFYPQGLQKPARLQGAFVSDDEVSAIVDYLKDRNPRTETDQKVAQEVNNAGMTSMAGGNADERDVYFIEAGKFIIEKDKASIGMLQRMFKIGFNRAARIMDQLCDAGVVGPEEGTKPRQVLMSEEQFENYIEENG